MQNDCTREALACFCILPSYFFLEKVAECRGLAPLARRHALVSTEARLARPVDIPEWAAEPKLDRAKAGGHGRVASQALRGSCPGYDVGFRNCEHHRAEIVCRALLLCQEPVYRTVAESIAHTRSLPVESHERTDFRSRSQAALTMHSSCPLRT